VKTAIVNTGDLEDGTNLSPEKYASPTAPKEHAVFEDVLKLFRLESKKLLTLLDLVRTLAAKNLRVQSGRPLTIYDMEERLHLFIPWTFLREGVEQKQTAKQARWDMSRLKQLENHFKKIHEILNEARFVPGESEKEDDPKTESVDQGPEPSSQGAT
jgi:hypothetical protein